MPTKQQPKKPQRVIYDQVTLSDSDDAELACLLGGKCAKRRRLPASRKYRIELLAYIVTGLYLGVVGQALASNVEAEIDEINTHAKALAKALGEPMIIGNWFVGPSCSAQVEELLCVQDSQEGLKIDELRRQLKLLLNRIKIGRQLATKPPNGIEATRGSKKQLKKAARQKVEDQWERFFDRVAVAKAGKNKSVFVDKMTAICIAIAATARSVQNG